MTPRVVWLNAWHMHVLSMTWVRPRDPERYWLPWKNCVTATVYLQRKLVQVVLDNDPADRGSIHMEVPHPTAHSDPHTCVSWTCSWTVCRFTVHKNVSQTLPLKLSGKTTLLRDVRPLWPAWQPWGLGQSSEAPNCQVQHPQSPPAARIFERLGPAKPCRRASNYQNTNTYHVYIIVIHSHPWSMFTMKKKEDEVRYSCSWLGTLAFSDFVLRIIILPSWRWYYQLRDASCPHDYKLVLFTPTRGIYHHVNHVSTIIFNYIVALTKILHCDGCDVAVFSRPPVKPSVDQAWPFYQHTQWPAKLQRPWETHVGGHTEFSSLSWSGLLSFKMWHEEMLPALHMNEMLWNVCCRKFPEKIHTNASKIRAPGSTPSIWRQKVLH